MRPWLLVFAVPPGQCEFFVSVGASFGGATVGWEVEVLRGADW